MNEIKCLDHGFVRLVDHMGDDQSIVDCARTSYAKGTKKVSEDRGLIRYLVRHLHTSPLESVVFKFDMKMPIFVARQLARHRTQSINEASLRFSLATDEFYIPDAKVLTPQSSINKQGRSEEVYSPEITAALQNIIKHISASCYEAYQNLVSNVITSEDTQGYDYRNHNTGGLFGLYKTLQLDENYSGIARELSRMVLPVNLYTHWYTTMNLHNLFHFLKLRMDKHTQYETRVYAEAMFELIKPIVPVACEAFTDYIFDGETYQNYVISRMEREQLVEMLSNYIGDGFLEEEHFIADMQARGMSKREIDEFKRKFNLNFS